MASHAATSATRHPENLLHRESSPYLLQHADNPVAWRPWGEAAFEEARRRQVPIFLSVGYSTCYWCHVMERESFEDPDVGQLMSELFVCVKVDREERPDVDQTYMTAVQAFTNHGGWPMSVFLTPPGARGDDDPGLEPFWGGTYFPPEPRHGMPSFPQLLRGIEGLWRDKRDAVLNQALTLTNAVRARLTPQPTPVKLDDGHVATARAQLMRLYDRNHAGFGGGPKFPQPVFLEFLLDLPDASSSDSSIRSAIRRTLDRMAMGGIYDHAAGGFHRYAVDDAWQIPHFEKMLYDNAQLASLYARASARFEDPMYERIARETLRYIQRDMTAPSGAFFSAQDAETDGREGLTYLWNKSQLAEALDRDDAEFAASLYGLDMGPNFQDPHHPDDPPSNVLRMDGRDEEVARSFNMTADELRAKREAVNAKLLETRSRRTQPRLDDKILAAWNGLMIWAFADAAAALNDGAFLDAAIAAADAVWSDLRDDDGALRRSRREDRPGPPAYLEDHACLALGFTAIERAARILRRDAGEALSRAAELTDDAQHRFRDPDSGAWLDTQDGHDGVLVRAFSTFDGAVPCGQSVMLHALLDLHELSEDRSDFLESAVGLLAAMSPSISDAPLGAVNATRALNRILRIENAQALFASAGMTTPGAPAPAFDPEDPTQNPPVEVYASASEVTVGPGEPAELVLDLRIQEGWHITAHEPFPSDTPDDRRLPGVSGLSVRLVNAQGVTATCDYPAGEPLDVGAGGASNLPTLLVHRERVTLELKFQRTGEPMGEQPRIAILAQPCTATECISPIALELNVALKVED